MDTKVLVVDDTDHVRNMLVDMLQLDGFEVVGQAASGREALALTADRQPDVVVIDYKMQDMDGLTAAKLILDERPSQAIILYAAFLDPQLESRAREVGVATCIGKVEALNQLERHISELTRDLQA